jgi:hypothetical protein
MQPIDSAPQQQAVAAALSRVRQHHAEQFAFCPEEPPSSHQVGAFKLLTHPSVHGTAALDCHGLEVQPRGKDPGRGNWGVEGVPETCTFCRLA